MSNALLDGIAGAFLGALVAVAGVYLTYRSMRASARDEATQATLELDRLFVQYPELRCYISDSARVPEEPSRHRERALAVVELVADTLEAILDKVKKRLIFNMYSHRDRISWARYVRDTLADSPEIDEFVHENAQWYPSITSRYPQTGAAHEERAAEQARLPASTAVGDPQPDEG